ncbi:Flp pilus assembly protein CpaB [Caldovatus sediminis]|uniref:Flp pilus assembly protein CpaB n=1 Tax=Caldovatus sediminis TaxID=2041189 RepID=A0A8J2ZE55_9PROT|nr:Flp pilus assembly protein CpaB [Caldovatus sediminis]GGG43577.1 Flp pilus assembly protein CpaB [Caldovatus sediminis]
MTLRTLAIACLLIAATALGYVALQMVRPPPPPVVAEAALPPPPPPPARTRLLVAGRALPAGTLLKDEDFTVREVPPEDVPEGALLLSEETRAEMRGALLRRYLDPGATIARSDFLRPRDRGFLAAVLRPGMRAISIGVDATTGAAGLIWPGDQVDVILTQEMSGSDAPLHRRVVSETIMSDVRVIAVDQQITQGPTGAESPAGRLARTVSLEVTPEQAERVAVARSLGRLDIVVRAVDQAPEDALARATTSVFSSDVSPALARSSTAPGARMRLIQGTERQELNFR